MTSVLDRAGVSVRLPEQMYAEDIDGVWHVRRDDFWDREISAKVRAHAMCGPIWSCHVSAFPPVWIEGDQPHCPVCFPHAKRPPRPPRHRRVKGLELVPVTRDQGRAFVRAHHRHSRPHRGEVIRVGLADDAGELVAVAVAGMPCRELMDGVTLEITRVCTLGHENACSRLYGALARAAKALGWRRLFTYTLASESGSSLLAAGFVRDGDVPARAYAEKNGSRPRYAENLLGERTMPEEAKVRWRRDIA